LDVQGAHLQKSLAQVVLVRQTWSRAVAKMSFRCFCAAVAPNFLGGWGNGPGNRVELGLRNISGRKNTSRIQDLGWSYFASMGRFQEHTLFGLSFSMLDSCDLMWLKLKIKCMWLTHANPFIIR
jgi:hypothetical protein